MIMESLLNGRIFGNPLHLHNIQPDGPDPYLTPTPTWSKLYS